MITILISAVVLGLTSSLHCVGMCGPLALAVPVKKSSIHSIWLGSIQYNLGRIFTYAILGLIVGNIGLSLNTLGFLQGLSIAAGIFVLFFALNKMLPRQVKWGVGGKLSIYLGRALGKTVKSDLPFKPFFFGVLNGFLPCGMVYLALVTALVSGGIGSSVLVMISFGLGTLPLLLVLTVFGKKWKWNFSTSKLYPLVLLAVSILMILRGMNLDIPYISPKISLSEQAEEKHFPEKKQENIEFSCCKKPLPKVR